MVLYDNESETKENKLLAKDKIERQRRLFIINCVL